MVVKRRKALNIGTFRYLSAITPETPYTHHPIAMGHSLRAIATSGPGNPYCFGKPNFKIVTCSVPETDCQIAE